MEVGINLAIKEPIDHIRIDVSLFMMMGLKDNQITVLMNLLEKLHDLIRLIEFFVTNLISTVKRSYLLFVVLDEMIRQ